MPSDLNISQRIYSSKIVNNKINNLTVYNTNTKYKFYDLISTDNSYT